MAMAGQGLLAQLSDELAAAVETAGRSIVRVNGRRRQAASGLVWAADGLIVTADHVIEREEDLTVALPDGKEVKATIAGRDPGTDLAVLKAEASGLQPIGQADGVKVGSLVVAVARPGENVSATLGVVSAVGGQVRTMRGGQLDGFIRTDAVLYPGYSGGALIDTAGQAIGLSTSHFGQGAGFAIRIGTVQRVAEALRTGGRVRRGYLGVSSQPVALPAAIRQQLGLAQESGLLLVGVEPGGPAEQGGLLIGDLLIALAGDPIRDTDDLQRALGSDRVGQALAARVVRGGQAADLSLTVGERPQ
ncbi:MAG TPA: trypsin-like peptidase domain-containing protein [Chloroflexota bacterium]